MRTCYPAANVRYKLGPSSLHIDVWGPDQQHFRKTVLKSVFSPQV
jgi:hypothetical protein